MNQRQAFWGFLIGAGPMLLGCVMILSGMVMRTAPIAYLAMPAILYAVGLAIFLRAKMSLVTRGHWVTFGPSLLSAPNQRLYKLGYVLMASATALTLIFLLQFQS